MFPHAPPSSSFQNATLSSTAQLLRRHWCRLRFSFVDVKPKADQKNDAPVKTGKSPILASVFSDVFQVYSAKKFPGVCDSTELSKCFATQGIKIPIRKEGGKGADNDDDDDD